MNHLRISISISSALLCAGLFLWPIEVSAQSAGGTLGIDCEVPRRSDSGKIILEWNDNRRIACEADRNAALHWSRMLHASANHLSAVLRSSEMRGFLENFSGEDFIPLSATQIENYLGQNTGYSLPFEPDDWSGHLNAGLCLSGGRLGKRARVLVWMDINGLRDRWAPEMVQRATWFWHYRRDELRLARAQTPHRLEREGSDWVSRHLDNKARILRACQGVAPGTAGFPAVGLLLVTADAVWTRETERTVDACPDGKFGFIEKKRRRVGRQGTGVYVDQQGQPLRRDDDTLTDSDDAPWTPTRTSCWDVGDGPEEVPDKKTKCESKVTVPASFGDYNNPECPAPLPRPSCAVKFSTFPQGKMVYYTRSYEFPDGSSRWDEVTGYRVENYCYSAVRHTRMEQEDRDCPVGHTGDIEFRRDIHWWQFGLAPNSKAQLPASLTFEGAKAALTTPPSRSVPPPFGQSSASEWVAWRSTCEEEPDDEYDGPDGEGSYDTDGDGITDSRTPGDNGGGYSNGGIGDRVGSGSRGDRDDDDE